MTGFLWAVLVPALLPVFFVFRYIYKKDKTEKEPMKLLLKVLIWGAIFSIPCCYIEMGMETILLKFFDENSLTYAYLENTVGVALVEEFSKWLVIMIFIWKNHNFDYSYDGIVYAATASLGFEALENILYIISYGGDISLGRAIFSIPGHATFGVFMGCYFSLGKKRFMENKSSTFHKLMALVIPTIIHGIYDFLLCDQLSEDYSYLFFIFVIILDFVAWQKIKKEAKKDKPLGVIREETEENLYEPKKYSHSSSINQNEECEYEIKDDE